MKLKLKIHEGAILAYLEEDGILLPPLLEQSSMMKLVNIVPFIRLYQMLIGLKMI